MCKIKRYRLSACSRQLGTESVDALLTQRTVSSQLYWSCVFTGKFQGSFRFPSSRYENIWWTWALGLAVLQRITVWDNAVCLTDRGCGQDRAWGWRRTRLRNRWNLPYRPHISYAMQIFNRLRSISCSDKMPSEDLQGTEDWHSPPRVRVPDMPTEVRSVCGRESTPRYYSRSQMLPATPRETQTELQLKGLEAP